VGFKILRCNILSGTTQGWDCSKEDHNGNMGGRGFVKVFENQKIKSRFRLCKIWPLNHVAMVEIFGLSELLPSQRKRFMIIHTFQMQQIETSDVVD
jgi:hypothetical protein